MVISIGTNLFMQRIGYYSKKNIGAYICIDEVALSRGELYTVLTNKEAHGGKGSMIAIIKGTDVHTVTSVLLKLSVAAVTKCAR